MTNVMFRCPYCGQTLVAEKELPQRAKCASCQRIFTPLDPPIAPKVQTAHQAAKLQNAARLAILSCALLLAPALIYFLISSVVPPDAGMWGTALLLTVAFAITSGGALLIAAPIATPKKNDMRAEVVLASVLLSAIAGFATATLLSHYSHQMLTDVPERYYISGHTIASQTYTVDKFLQGHLAIAEPDAKFYITAVKPPGAFASDEVLPARATVEKPRWGDRIGLRRVGGGTTDDEQSAYKTLRLEIPRREVPTPTTVTGYFYYSATFPRRVKKPGIVAAFENITASVSTHPTSFLIVSEETAAQFRGAHAILDTRSASLVLSYALPFPYYMILLSWLGFRIPLR